MELIFFVLGGVALISGGLVVFQRHPLRSALWLIVNFFAVAGIPVLLLIYTITRVALPPGKALPPGLGNTESIAKLLFTDYLLPFEVTSVLLLVAIVGAVVLAKTRLQ